jgi:DNA polymerase I
MQAHKLGELIPRRTEQPYIPYQGSIVLEPKPGIHDNVAVLDFTSMYPNLMILHNLSPDTYVDSNELPKCKVMIAPEVGFKFRKSPAGFYKIVLENLISIRGILKNKLSQIDPNSSEHRVLKEREKAIKVITNACYGYAGWVGARWYVPQVAQAAAAYGRATLRRVFKIAEGLNLSLIYADTDAIFVEFDQYKVKRLLKKVEAEMKMEITVNKVYSRVLFTEAKKKYAGLLPDGTLDIVGLEVVRGDWSNVAKTAQGKVLELVLKEKDAQNAVMYLREFIRDLRLGRVRLSDLAIWKTLTKPVESYKVKAPHVEVARALLREGWNLKVGDKVGFVIVKGAGRLYEKAKPYNAASLEQIDIEYYVTNQILPAALRILGMFGIDESTALGDPKPSLSSCLNSP